MPVGQSGDYVLDGKPYLLARGEFKGRAWRREPRVDALQGRQNRAEAERSSLPSEIDFVAAYDDFSGGFGYAYRTPGQTNTVHWSENIDLRWPRQAVHCQIMQGLSTANYASFNTRVEYLLDVPVPSAANQPPGAGVVLVTGRNFVARVGPTGVSTAGSQFDAAIEASIPAGQILKYQPAVAEAFTFIPIPQGFLRRTHDAVYTQSDIIGARNFVTAGNRLWRNTSFLLQSIAIGQNPFATANWSATLAIGNQSDPMNDLIELNDQVFAGMPDGLYAGDLSGTFFNVLSTLRNSRHQDNSRDLTIYDNGVVVPHVGGLYWYQPSDFVNQAREIGPHAYGADRSPIQGRFRAVTGYGPWLYAGLWSGSQTYLLAGQDVGLDRYRWHVLNRLPEVARVNRIHFDSITNASGNPAEIAARMWIATDGSINTAGTSPLYWHPIPRLNGNPLIADPAFSPNYVASARFDLGRDNLGAPNVLKVFRRVDVNTEVSTLTMSVNQPLYADIYYSIDGGDRTLLGRADVSPKSTLYFPSGQGSFVTGYDIELSIESTTKTTGKSPVYRSIEIHGAFRPTAVDEITAITRIADDMADRRGTPMRSGSAQLADLRALSEPTGLPVRLVDPIGAVHWVTVLPGVTEQETYQEGSEEPEISATVRMVVLDFG